MYRKSSTMSSVRTSYLLGKSVREFQEIDLWKERVLEHRKTVRNGLDRMTKTACSLWFAERPSSLVEAFAFGIQV